MDDTKFKIQARPEDIERINKAIESGAWKVEPFNTKPQVMKVNPIYGIYLSLTNGGWFAITLFTGKRYYSWSIRNPLTIIYGNR